MAAIASSGWMQHIGVGEIIGGGESPLQCSTLQFNFSVLGYMCVMRDKMANKHISSVTVNVHKRVTRNVLLWCSSVWRSKLFLN